MNQKTANTTTAKNASSIKRIAGNILSSDPNFFTLTDVDRLRCQRIAVEAAIWVDSEVDRLLAPEKDVACYILRTRPSSNTDRLYYSITQDGQITPLTKEIAYAYRFTDVTLAHSKLIDLEKRYNLIFQVIPVERY